MLASSVGKVRIKSVRADFVLLYRRYVNVNIDDDDRCSVVAGSSQMTVFPSEHDVTMFAVVNHQVNRLMLHLLIL